MSGVVRAKSIICDLDGTIALDDHRAHLIQVPPGERKWDEYFALCHLDARNDSVITILQALRFDYQIHIISGRSDTTWEKTKQWLWEHEVPYDTVNLREASDRTDDHVLKIQVAQKAGWTPDKVEFVLEDRQRVVDAWRDAGYTCFQVAPGNF